MDEEILGSIEGLFGLRVNRDMNSELTILDSKHPLYMLSNLYTQESIFNPFEIIEFLSGINCDDLIIKSKLNKNKIYKKDSLTYQFDRCIDVMDQFVKEEEITTKKILKVYFDSQGNHFLVQIKNTSKKIKYVKKKIKINDSRVFNAYIFIPCPLGTPTLTNPQGFNPNKIIKIMSRYFNSKNNLDVVNSFTSNAFADICPLNEKVLLSRDDHYIQNAKDLFDIFNVIGGHLFLIPGNGTFRFDNEEVKAFCWLPDIINNLLILGCCIELDCSFKAVEDNVFCVPMIIYRNTGIPIGLITGPSECSQLYSMLYNSIFKIDDSLFKSIIEKFILSDQHSSFDTLRKRFGLKLFHCYVHIIRSFGSSSSISILVREVLFCKSENEFQNKLPRIIRTFKKLLQVGGSAQKHKDKFISILGYNENGEEVDREPEMEPLFIRMKYSVPTSTNHIERFHRYVNESVKPFRNKYRKLAILIESIIEQINRADTNLLRKLKDYITNLKQKALKIICEEPEKINSFNGSSCTNELCADDFYYSNLYQCELPCLHQILNEKWKKYDDFSLEDFGIEPISLKYEDTELHVDFLDDEFVEKEQTQTDVPTDNNVISYNVEITEHFEGLYAQMVNITYSQLYCVMGSKIKLQEVAGIACEMQALLLQNEDNAKLLAENPDDFMVILSVEIIIKAYETKNMINKF